MKPLDPQTYHAILKRLAEHSHPMAGLIELIARTGMRSHELLSHKPEHINLRDGMLFIKAAKGSDDRWIPAPKAYLRAIQTKAIPEIKPQTLKRLLRRVWAEIRQDVLGVGHGDVTLHSLRASFAVALYQNTKDILLTKELLGHRKIESTMAYTKIVQGKERRMDVLKAITGRRGS
jgi:integrase/recombinase XerD